MNEAGQEAQTAEGDIDERVGGANTTLDPDCEGKSVYLPFRNGVVHAAVEKKGLRRRLTSDGWEKNGQDAEEDVAAAHDVCLSLFVMLICYLSDGEGDGER